MTKHPGMPLAPEDLAALRALSSALERATAAAAEATGALLVPVSRASRSHGVGAKAPWVTGAESGDPLAGEPIPFHPNPAGMAAVADLVLGRLASR